MKAIILISVLLLCVTAFADSFQALRKERIIKSNNLMASSLNQELNFSCSTSKLTTSVVVETVAEKVIMKIIHHYGPLRAPIHAGIITSADIPYISNKAKLVQGMGDAITLEFDKNRCHVLENDVYECFNSKPMKIGNQLVLSSSFQTYKSVVNAYGSAFEKFHFFFSFNIDNFIREVRYDYMYKTNCYFN